MNFSLKFYSFVPSCCSSDVLLLFLQHQNHPVCDAPFGCSGDDCQEKNNFPGSIN